MNDKKANKLVIFSAIFLVMSGVVLYYIFERQGYDNKGERNYVNYSVSDYVVTTPVIFSGYDNFYSSINVSKLDITNIDPEVTKTFINEEKELLNYISGYYNNVMPKEGYTPVNTATSNIKTQINGAVLSIFYQMNIKLDENLFEDNEKSYIVTTNIDLAAERELTVDDLLTKYNYTKKYISEKIFEEDVLIGNGEVVIDKNTNISLTKQDVEKRKEEYINRIADEFNNIIKVYIENNYLTLVYDKKELNNLFFDNKFNTDIKVRYLK